MADILYLKNIRGIKSISAGKLCALGFAIDIRANEKRLHNSSRK